MLTWEAIHMDGDLKVFKEVEMKAGYTKGNLPFTLKGQL